jgi:hypothetical protein
VATRPHSSALGRTSGLVVRSDLAGAMVLVQRAAARATCRAGFVQYDIRMASRGISDGAPCGGWAARNRKEQSIGSRFVNRATLAALVLGPEGDGGLNLDYEWVQPEQSSHVAKAILLELAAKKGA